MMWRRRLTITLSLVSIAAPLRILAQDSRLTTKLPRETAAAITKLIDSARALSLPTDPLVGVALEGVNRHATNDRIVRAVREYIGALRTSRQALGDGATDAEVVSGAGVVLSGVNASVLHDLRAARPREALTVPLVVLADLVARGVPLDTATRAVYVATRAGARDADFTLLRHYIEQDISAGASPAAATSLRLRNVPGVTPEDLQTQAPAMVPRRPNP
jgi:hypothetical protein